MVRTGANISFWPPAALFKTVGAHSMRGLWQYKYCRILRRPDAAREIFCRVCRMCPCIDMDLLLQLGKRQSTASQATMLIQERRNVAASKYLPAEWQMLRVDARVQPEVSGAVGRQLSLIHISEPTRL